MPLWGYLKNLIPRVLGGAAYRVITVGQRLGLGKQWTANTLERISGINPSAAQAMADVAAKHGVFSSQFVRQAITRTTLINLGFAGRFDRVAREIRTGS